MLGSGIRRFDGEALGGRRLARTPPRRVMRWLAASTTAPPAPEEIAVLSSAGDDSRPHHVFRPQNRGVVIQALPRGQLKGELCQILTFPQWVLPLQRPDNHQLRTAMVTANWRGCEGTFFAECSAPDKLNEQPARRSDGEGSAQAPS